MILGNQRGEKGYWGGEKRKYCLTTGRDGGGDAFRQTTMRGRLVHLLVGGGELGMGAQVKKKNQCKSSSKAGAPFAKKRAGCYNKDRVKRGEKRVRPGKKMGDNLIRKKRKAS